MPVLRPPDFPCLFPVGFHHLSMVDLERVCVDYFSLSMTRRPIMDGLTQFMQRLDGANVRGDVWANGSFLTEKIDPKDVDIIVRIDGDAIYDKGTLEQRSAIGWVIANQKATLKCDSYVLMEYQASHHLRTEGQWWYSYWHKQWGFSREDDPKGTGAWCPMSRLEDLQRELQRASAAVVRAERTLAANPDVPSVAATLRTIQKRRENLEQQFLAVAAQEGLEVCGYRIELQGKPASIAALTAVLSSFQKVFTSVYDALVHGPKRTSKTSADTVAATELSFAYTYPGSLGVMMTLPNDRGLFGETKLEEAMGQTLELLSARDIVKVEAMTEIVGLPAVRFAHQWASENAKAGFGADIQWFHDDSVKRELRLQTQEIAEVASSIRQATATEEIVVIGELQDVALSTRTFQMKLSDKIIHGEFKDAINALHPVLLPKTYRATLNVMQKIVIEDGKEEITYFLMRLEPPDGAVVPLPDLLS
jgi:hypothetical protein